MNTTSNGKTVPIKTFVTAAAVCAMVAGGMAYTTPFSIAGAAWADENDGGGQSTGQGNQGGQGKGGQGSQQGQGNQGGSGSGQGGPDETSDGKGPQAGGPADTSSGGKPIWAQEGLPEVELGRLSVARSPAHVLERSLDEALKNITPEIIAFYSLSLDEMITAMSLDWDADSTAIYDSPLQSLALFQDAMDGTSVLVNEGVSNTTDTLLAVFLGVASDKVVEISTDTVIAVSTILGSPITGTDAEALAADAEAIRVAVLAGHG